MKLKGNTILITGGGSGIGKGLALAFHELGNKVIIAGRDTKKLNSTIDAHPGMEALSLDIANTEDTQRFAAEVSERYPALNVLINNAGIMKLENLREADFSDAVATVQTNLLGPICLTTSLLPHLLRQPSATIINVSSGLAFVPLMSHPTYSATKAALHSFSISLREQLAGTSVSVVELPPPYVQTELTGEHQAVDPRAMPLDEFISESMELLGSDESVREVLVERVTSLRFAERDASFDEVLGHLSQMAAEFLK